MMTSSPGSISAWMRRKSASCPPVVTSTSVSGSAVDAVVARQLAGDGLAQFEQPAAGAGPVRPSSMAALAAAMMWCRRRQVGVAETHRDDVLAARASSISSKMLTVVGAGRCGHDGCSRSRRTPPTARSPPGAWRRAHRGRGGHSRRWLGRRAILAARRPRRLPARGRRSGGRPSSIARTSMSSAGIGVRRDRDELRTRWRPAIASSRRRANSSRRAVEPVGRAVEDGQGGVLGDGGGADRHACFSSRSRFIGLGRRRQPADAPAGQPVPVENEPMVTTLAPSSGLPKRARAGS